MLFLYQVKTVSPLDLYLDPKNPRFIIPGIGGEQSDIRKYLISQEDVLSLARGIAENKGLMPGERIVICVEDGKDVVLEGNRRTCACQMFLNRALIPSGYESRFPATTDELKNNIQQVEVDIISSRTEAKRFLATRHIERAKEWSTIAKMRFCYEDYKDGKNIDQINDRTGLSKTIIRKYIRNYKILLRGIESRWTEEEKQKLNLLDIEPDKLLRMFTLKDTKSELALYYDDFELRSTKISDDDLDEIIHIWTKKAFIDGEMDTRSVFGKYNKDGDCTGACAFIKHILDKYDSKKIITTDNDRKPQSLDINSTLTQTDSSTQDTKLSSTPNSTVQKNSQQPQGGGPGNLPFFSTLNWDNVDPTKNENKGIIAICTEMRKISNSVTFIDNYPICTAFIIRALIEHSLKYHARKNGYWAEIMNAYNAPGKPSREPTLSFIINKYKTNIGQWINESTICRLFDVVFNFSRQTEKLNLVVHSPESYMLTPESLKAIPSEGLLQIVNYLLK